MTNMNHEAVDREAFRLQFCKEAADRGISPSELAVHVKASFIDTLKSLGAGAIGLASEFPAAVGLTGAALLATGAYGGNQLAKGLGAIKDEVALDTPDSLTPSQEQLGRDLIRRYGDAARKAKQMNKHPKDAPPAEERFMF